VQTRRKPKTKGRAETLPYNDMKVEVIPGPATEEQKKALKSFMSWYMAQCVHRVALQKGP
jgi:hypothetical protein